MKINYIIIAIILIFSCQVKKENFINNSKNNAINIVIERQEMKKFFDDMIDEALKKFDREKSIYTFAFYHDHESDAVSICIDTEDNSMRKVSESNEYTRKYFYNFLEQGDMDSIKLWNFQTGRNYSLGDFSFVNIVYKNTEKELFSPSIYLEMIKSIERNKNKILKHSKNPEKVFFYCSSESNEVQYIWQ